MVFDQKIDPNDQIRDENTRNVQEYTKDIILYHKHLISSHEKVIINTMGTTAEILTRTRKTKACHPCEKKKGYEQPFQSNFQKKHEASEVLS